MITNIKYSPEVPLIDMIKDPDWFYKMKPKRARIKGLIALIILFGFGIK